MKKLYLLIGVLLLPAAAGSAVSLWDSILLAAGASGGFTVENISLLSGIIAFSLCWTLMPVPVRTYVLAHELTHAMWGVIFGAKASDIRVSERGGSVRLTKSNMLITLAPYFFPFYTFVVIVSALVTYAFMRPLPFLPLWLFLIGFTWAFHVLFTVDTLRLKQQDIVSYGKLFSWVFILLANIFFVQLWLVFTTPLTFQQLAASFADRSVQSYRFAWHAIFKTVGSITIFVKSCFQTC